MEQFTDAIVASPQLLRRHPPQHAGIDEWSGVAHVHQTFRPQGMDPDHYEEMAERLAVTFR